MCRSKLWKEHDFSEESGCYTACLRVRPLTNFNTSKILKCKIQQRRHRLPCKNIPIRQKMEKIPVIKATGLLRSYVYRLLLKEEGMLQHILPQLLLGQDMPQQKSLNLWYVFISKNKKQEHLFSVENKIWFYGICKLLHFVFQHIVFSLSFWNCGSMKKRKKGAKGGTFNLKSVPLSYTICQTHLEGWGLHFVQIDQTLLISQK